MTAQEEESPIQRLDNELKALIQAVEGRRFSDSELEDHAREIEDIDRSIAQLPVGGLDDLVVKIERLVGILHPSDEPLDEEYLEHLLLSAVLRDARALAVEEHENGE